jgi:hypothetical protein
VYRAIREVGAVMMSKDGKGNQVGRIVTVACAVISVAIAVVGIGIFLVGKPVAKESSPMVPDSNAIAEAADASEVTRPLANEPNIEDVQMAPLIYAELEQEFVVESLPDPPVPPNRKLTPAEYRAWGDTVIGDVGLFVEIRENCLKAKLPINSASKSTPTKSGRLEKIA